MEWYTCQSQKLNFVGSSPTWGTNVKTGKAPDGSGLNLPLDLIQQQTTSLVRLQLFPPIWIMVMHTLVMAFLLDRNIPDLVTNCVVLRTDDSCSMSQVEVNGCIIMFGNDWDFHPGCHGFALPDFDTPKQLAEMFAEALECDVKYDDSWVFE